MTLSVPVVPPPHTGAAAAAPATHALGFIVPRERFRAMLAKAAGHDGGGAAWSAAVYDRAGRLVAGGGADGAAEGEHARPDTLQLLARRGEGVARGGEDRGGNRVVSAFAHAPRAGFGAVVSAPRDALYAPLRRTLWRGAGFASVLLAGSVGLAMFWSRRVAAAFVLAQALAASLAALGMEVVGPAGSLDDALRLAATAPALDAAMLDLNLAGQNSFPVADVLAGRRVPMVFATGYANLPAGGIAERHGAVPVLRKPLAHADLVKALRDAMAGVGVGAAAASRRMGHAALA